MSRYLITLAVAGTAGGLVANRYLEMTGDYLGAVFLLPVTVLSTAIVCMIVWEYHRGS